MTDAEIRNGYLAKHGRLMSQEDLSGLRELMQRFDCEDSTSFEDAHERIVASLKLIVYGI